MADSVSFALILTKNLKLKNLKLSQIETVIKVTAGMDPLTLQQMRDEVSDSFKARRDNLNKFIEASEKLLDREPDKKKRQQKAGAVIAKMNADVKKFEANLTKRVNDFCAAEEKRQAEFEKSQVKFTVSTLWSAANILKDTVGGISALFASAVVPAVTLAAAKAIADLLLDIKGLYGSLSDACKSHQKVQQEIVNSLKKIKATKPPKPIAKSQLNQLESQIKLYEDKLDSIEMYAKSLAKKLNGVLNFAEKNKGISDEAKKRIKKFVTRNLKDIVSISNDVNKGKRNIQSFNDKYKEASKRSKTDARSIFDWALSFYDMANKLITWGQEWGDTEKMIDLLVTFTTSDDFFEPVTV